MQVLDLSSGLFASRGEASSGWQAELQRPIAFNGDY